MSSMQPNRLGIDIGGTFIKFILLSGKYVVQRSKIPTESTSQGIVDSIKREYDRMTERGPILSVGVGFPGEILNGLVSADNLPFHKYPLQNQLEKCLGCVVKIENDANCAALGELYFGKAREYQNIVMITLGTGIGGGIILNRQIYAGTGLAGEIGHMIIHDQERTPCSCGRYGCWEQYASVTALIREAKKAAHAHPESILYEMYNHNENIMNGELFFRSLKAECPVAKGVFAQYIHHLTVGIENIANILAPDVIVIAGGITEEKDLLLKALRAELNVNVCVEVSALKNDAGSLGASALWMDYGKEGYFMLCDKAGASIN